MTEHYKLGQRPRPKSPKPPPFAALRKRLGVPLDAKVEPESVVGPAVSVLGRYHNTVACSGTFRVIEEGAVHHVACCDACHAEVTVPAAALDPAVAQRRRLDHAALPGRFAGIKFVEDDDNRSALRALRQWIGSQSSDPKECVSSLLPAPAVWGDAGRGKSHLLAAISVRLVHECDVTVLYRSTRHLLRELQQFERPKNGDPDAGADQAWRRAMSVDVLVLDDLGAQRGTEWRHDQLADLIDERYAREQPIVIATNYPPEAWERVLDARTHSRLRAMTFPIELAGPDRRQPDNERTEP